ncbi:MAG: FeoB-associated Cys-rich membrane protein [[Clostridium] innocuum]
MNIADVIVIAVLLAILAVIVYATRPKKREGLRLRLLSQ